MSRGLAFLGVVVLALAACSADPLPGFRPASADQRSALLQIVVEYYDLVDRAIVTGDVAPLYLRHPGLAQGRDQGRGINVDGSAAVSPTMRELDVREASVDVESYEPLRAFVKDDRAVAYSHGLFTWTYANGSHTKGEKWVRFDLTKNADRWLIERTDEWVLGEGTPPPTPR